MVNANTSRLAEFYLPKEGERDNLVEITPHKEEPSVLFKLNDSTLLLRTSPAIDIFKSHQLTLKVRILLFNLNVTFVKPYFRQSTKLQL